MCRVHPLAGVVAGLPRPGGGATAAARPHERRPGPTPPPPAWMPLQGRLKPARAAGPAVLAGAPWAHLRTPRPGPALYAPRRAAASSGARASGARAPGARARRGGVSPAWPRRTPPAAGPGSPAGAPRHLIRPRPRAAARQAPRAGPAPREAHERRAHRPHTGQAVQRRRLPGVADQGCDRPGPAGAGLLHRRQGRAVGRGAGPARAAAAGRPREVRPRAAGRALGARSSSARSAPPPAPCAGAPPPAAAAGPSSGATRRPSRRAEGEVSALHQHYCGQVQELQGAVARDDSQYQVCGGGGWEGSVLPA
jgi:hypothetical protein